MMQVITQAATDTAKAAIMAVREAENPVNAARSVQLMPRTSSPTLKQSKFNLKQQTNIKNYETLR